METYLTVNEVALMLMLSAQTIRRYTRKNEIPYHKIFRAVRYRKSEIEQWVEREKCSTVKGQREKVEASFFDMADGGGEA